MEAVGSGVPVAAQVDDGHAAVEGERDRVAGPAGTAVVIADEYRTEVEHRHVPVETTTSGIALAQTVHIVGLRQYFGVRLQRDGIVIFRLFAVGNEYEQPDVGAVPLHREHCLGCPEVEPGGHAADERVVTSFAQAFDDPRASFPHDPLHLVGIAPLGRARHLADAVAAETGRPLRIDRKRERGKAQCHGRKVRQAAKKGVRRKRVSQPAGISAALRINGLSGFG